LQTKLNATIILNMKIAMAQMISTNDLDANLKKMRQFVSEAKKKGAELVAFPEMAYFSGTPDECARTVGKHPELMVEFSRWAKDEAIDIIPGSLREPDPSGGKPFNSAAFIASGGEVKAHYRKIFLFRAALSDRSYDETKQYSHGTEVTAVTRPWGTIGLSICFDLRFPELFRSLKKRGAHVIFLPSAFTVPTGRVHWHTLLRARATENQCFVFAPGQTGSSGEGSAKFGHSLAVSPWGEVLVDMEEDEGVSVTEISLSQIEECARRVDVWFSRREDLFPIA
jgi:deaminated glutathione amidase